MSLCDNRLSEAILLRHEVDRVKKHVKGKSGEGKRESDVKYVYVKYIILERGKA